MASTGPLIATTTIPVTMLNNVSVEKTDGKEFFETAQFINGVILYPLICIPGLFGNILTLIVLSQKNMRTSTNVFLSALAVSDGIKLINDLLYFCVMVLFLTDPEKGQTAFVHIYPHAHFIFNVSACVSSWLTVSVAVERYILVCHPTKARDMCTKQRAIITSVCVNIFMLLVSIPCALRYKTVKFFDRSNNKTVSDIELTELWENTEFVIYYTWIINFLRCNIPLIILIILNACIINALRKTRAQRKHAQRHRVTFMMIIVIMTFLLCITPDAVMSTFLGFGYHEDDFYVKGIREFSDTLLTINAAVNFIIYCVLSRTFRQNFVKLFCRTKTDKETKKKCDPWYRRLSEQPSFWNNKRTSRHSSV